MHGRNIVPKIRKYDERCDYNIQIILYKYEEPAPIRSIPINTSQITRA